LATHNLAINFPQNQLIQFWVIQSTKRQPDKRASSACHGVTQCHTAVLCARAPDTGKRPPPYNNPAN